MRRDRFATIAVMASETGKTIGEADPEVSEAIDFAKYYAGPGIDLLADLGQGPTAVETGGRGVVAVVGPWNFPYAIPAGGTFAALAAGNAVVLKPAPESVQVAAVFVDQLRRSGLDPDLVQLVVCADGPVGRHLVTHDDIDTVVLTGSYETAELFRSLEAGAAPVRRDERQELARDHGDRRPRPGPRRPRAIGVRPRRAEVLRGEPGDRRSAALRRSRVPPAVARHRRQPPRRAGRDDPATIIGPVIAAPTGKLERALTTLDRGERWLVEPATARRLRPVVATRCARRRAGGIVVPPHRVLRSRARADPGPTTSITPSRSRTPASTA